MADTNTIFDHIKDPLETASFSALYKMWFAIPYIDLRITTEIMDRLDSEGRLKYVLKRDFNRIHNQLSKQAKDYIDFYYNNKEFDNAEAFLEKFVSEFITAFSSYFSIYHKLDEYSREKDVLECYKRNVFSRMQFLAQLEKNDRFVFVDEPEYKEFTFLSLYIQNNEIFCNYTKENSDTFYTANAWRPVIKVNVEMDKREMQYIRRQIRKLTNTIKSDIPNSDTLNSNIPNSNGNQ